MQDNMQIISFNIHKVEYVIIMSLLYGPILMFLYIQIFKGALQDFISKGNILSEHEQKVFIFNDMHSYAN